MLCVMRWRRAQKIWVFFRGTLDEPNAVRRAASLTSGCVVASRYARPRVQRAACSMSTGISPRASVQPAGRSMRDPPRNAICGMRSTQLTLTRTRARTHPRTRARKHEGAVRADREPSASVGDRRLSDHDCTQTRSWCPRAPCVRPIRHGARGPLLRLSRGSHAPPRVSWCASHPAAFGRVQCHGRRRATSCRLVACEGAERGSSEMRAASGVPHSATRNPYRAMYIYLEAHNISPACRMQSATLGLQQQRATYPLQHNVP